VERPGDSSSIPLRRTCRLVRNPILCLTLPGTSCLLLFSETHDSARPFSSVVLLHSQVNPRFPIYSEERGDRRLLYTYLGRKLGKAIGYGLNDRGAGFRVSVGCCPYRLWGPTTLLYDGYREALSSGVKRQKREADYLPSTSAEVKEMWIYTSTPPYSFMAYCLITRS
jgi:hypothetical protein